jgi:hypothetical protein
MDPQIVTITGNGTAGGKAGRGCVETWPRRWVSGVGIKRVSSLVSWPARGGGSWRD